MTTSTIPTVSTPNNVQVNAQDGATMTNGQVSSSVELTLTAKGLYTWTIKCYVEADRLETPDGQTSLVTILSDLDAKLRTRFATPAPQR